MTSKEGQQQGSKRSLICGLVGWIGCFSAIATDLIGSIVVEKHNPISETISSLAIGKAAWIQDLGLDLFAIALIACAVGLYPWKLGTVRWKAGLALLILLGVDIFLISEHNKYAGREDVTGAAIHIYCVYALGVLFTLAPLLLSFGLQKISPKWRRFSLGIALGWTIFAPTFFFIPTDWDGAFERLTALIMIVWVAAISQLLLRHGLGELNVRLR